MLTYKTGIAGSPSSALPMARHLTEPTLPSTYVAIARYYAGDPPLLPDCTDHRTRALPRPDLDPELAKILRVPLHQPLDLHAVSCLLAGLDASGRPIPGKQRQSASKTLREEIGLVPGRLPTPLEVERILQGRRADTGAALPPERASHLRRRFFDLFGRSDDAEEPSSADLDALCRGCRPDGQSISVAEFTAAIETTAKQPVAFIDLCFAADKSVSVAWALAQTDAERAIFAAAHRKAVVLAMAHIETVIGRARKGKAGSKGSELGTTAWFMFEHFTSRPTSIDTPEPSEVADRRLVDGDPHLHTHVAVLNCVRTADGRLGALDLQQLRGSVKEFGGLYQAFLAAELRRAGADVQLDRSLGSARLTAISDTLRDAFSKRTRGGEAAARRFTDARGLDFEQLDESAQVKLRKAGVQGDPRSAKTDDIGNWESWFEQAASLGWKPQSFLTREWAPDGQRCDLDAAYNAAVPMIEAALLKRAVIRSSDLRTAAARALIGAGVDTAADIDTVVRLFTERGVVQEGSVVRLIPLASQEGSGRERAYTTSLHVDREREFIALASEAAADRSGPITDGELERALARAPLDFSTDHGRAQRSAIDSLGKTGRLGVVIGVAGSGKTALLSPLVDCWTSQGKDVHGLALAWRQAEALQDAGVRPERCRALARFLSDAKRGVLALSSDSVVALDEVGQIGTRDFLELLRLRALYGFKLVALGDPKQCGSIEAGATIDLLREALGSEAIPEILTSVRQQTEQERAVSLMFRDGQASRALAQKRADGTARLVSGPEQDVVRAIADLWMERRTANLADPEYSLTVSTPTHAEARLIAREIRLRRRELGELDDDVVIVEATDATGAEFSLPLARGDRVRLFARTNAARTDGKEGILGNNGSVLTVVEIDDRGLTLRNQHGGEGCVSWNTLRDDAGRCRLTYGDVLTIDAAQGLTSSEHIQAFPRGTRQVDLRRAYVSASRHRRSTYAVFGESAERRELADTRRIGETVFITEAEVWDNIAKNLSRAPIEGSAHAVLRRSRALKETSVSVLRFRLHKMETRRAAGRAKTSARSRRARALITSQLYELARDMLRLVRDRGSILERIKHGIGQRAPLGAGPAELAPKPASPRRTVRARKRRNHRERGTER